MSSVPGTTTGSPYVPSVSEPVSTGAPTSPEGIIALLTSRLRDSDGQIAAITNRMHGRTAKAKELNNKMSALNEQRSKITEEDGKLDISDNPELRAAFADPEYSGRPVADIAKEIADVDASIRKLGSKGARALKEGSQLVAEREKLGTEIDAAHKGAPTKVTGAQLDAKINALQQELAAVNGDNEIELINLQSLFSQRQQQISLSTNILKKIDDSAAAIVSNMR